MPTLKKLKENLNKNVVDFAQELESKFPNVVFTSGYRQGAKTTTGNTSRHSHGEALDFRIDPEISKYLESDEGIKLLHKYQLGFLDESKSENKKWGNSLHVGFDSRLVENTNKRFKNITPSETYTEGINYLENSPNTTTFVPDKGSEKVDKEVIEVEDKTKEYNFLQEIQKFSKENQPLYTEVNKQVNNQNQVEQPNYLQQYEQISNFVDNPIAQQGGNIVDEDKKWLQDWYSNRIIPDKQQNEDFAQVKPKYLENLKNLPSPTYVENNTLGGAEGDYKGGINPILRLTKGSRPSTKLHEYTHAVTNTGGSSFYDDMVSDTIHLQANSKNDVKDLWTKDNYNYLVDPDEISARLQVLRKSYNFNPTEEITPERIKQIRENRKESDPNIKNLLDLYKDENLSKVLNTVAYNDKKNNNFYVQQGGEFSENELTFLSEIAIKDKNGYWNINNKGKVVEIPSNSITMKGVNQKLVGISKETGEKKVMLPNKEYLFKNTKNVIEIPFYKK